jgi:tRNA nucleotidyltransferase (CCA-adding enzyme)
MHDRLGDHRAQLRHALAEPCRNPAVVKGQIGAARPSSHESSREQIGNHHAPAARRAQGVRCGWRGKAIASLTRGSRFFVMARKFPSRPLPDLAQTHPALGILRLASLLAESEMKPESDELDMLFEQVDAGFLLDMSSAELWPELVRGLLGRAPAKMIQILRECGALSQILPEVAALFGVPQLSDQAADVDLGEHVLATLAEAARRDVSLQVRFSLLVMNVGKGDSPREHLPHHYKHMERGRPRIEALCDRFGVSLECRDLALLALAECERAHRVSRSRAGPVALMLERLGAFDVNGLFDQLMLVCACDYAAYPGRASLPYPKAVLLDLALRACAGIDIRDFASEADPLEAARGARALAIARALNSQRWSGETP